MYLSLQNTKDLEGQLPLTENIWKHEVIARIDVVAKKREYTSK